MRAVRLRNTTEPDLDFVLRAESDDANRGFVTVWSRELHLAAIGSDDSAHLIIESPGEVHPVGYVILAGLTDPNQTIELRRIVVTMKGKGYGRAALQWIKHRAFIELKAHRLWLDVKEHNSRARRLYESEGFTIEGTLRDCIRTETGFESLVIMSILQPEYATRNRERIVLETERLCLRQLSTNDAEFMLRLLNEPSFVENIADKGVRTIEGARAYIQNGPVASYNEFGFGLWLVEIRNSGRPIGICGILKRPVLEDADLGYALVPEYWSRGYALEAASAVMDYSRRVLGLRRLAAIVNHDNESSLRLLQKLGFKFERMIRLTEEAEEIQLLVKHLN